MNDFEAGKRALEALIAEHGSSTRTANEAATRLHIIDSLLQNVLGWPKPDLNPERYHAGAYSDYELGSPPALLVEAKREGTHFDLPPNVRPTLPIRDLKSLSPDLQGAVSQAMGYAQQRGIRLAAIANGHQLAAFVASRQDGIAPDNGRALVFGSLEDMLGRFRQLWETLSPAGVRDHGLELLLDATNIVPAPAKLSASLTNYPGFKNRNPVAADLQILGGLFVEDLAKEPRLQEQFLAETYCKSGALSQYALVSKEILTARYSESFQSDSEVSAAAVVNRKGLNPALSHDMFAAALSRRPILLVGDVGVGKSMFIKHLVKVEAKDELKSAIVLYIDFGSKPALTGEIHGYVARELKRQLLDDYGVDVESNPLVRATYNGELRRFENGIYGDLKDTNPTLYADKERAMLAEFLEDADTHLRRVLEHIVKGRKQSVIIFLDNVDQRQAAFQEEVFLVAQSIAEHWPATTFVALRPETFSHSRVSGALAAYQPRVFTIEPPRVDRVLSKRMNFAVKLLKSEGTFSHLPSGFSFRSESLLNYLNVLKRAFASGDANAEIIEFVDNMSGGNLRKALDFVASFIGSGHVDSRKILEIEERDYYTLPLHEFLRAVMFGDGEYYSPDKSPIPNVLDIATSDGREHFLVCLLIGFSESLGRAGERKGYVPRADVAQVLHKAGFHPDQVNLAMARALTADLVATPTNAQDSDSIRVTSRGVYAIRRLVGMFAYVDAIVTDTPIIDATTRAVIRDVVIIDERVERCRAFSAYLDHQWAKINNLPAGGTFDWPRAEAALQADLARVEASLKRSRNKRN